MLPTFIKVFGRWRIDNLNGIPTYLENQMISTVYADIGPGNGLYEEWSNNDGDVFRIYEVHSYTATYKGVGCVKLNLITEKESLCQNKT